MSTNFCERIKVLLSSFFAVILILVSQRADDDVIRIFGTERMKHELAEEQLRQRGRGPTKLELLVVLYLIGFMWEEVQEIFNVGIKSYLRNMWNFIDFLRNSLYVSVVCLRAFAYIQQATEIAHDPKMAYVPREKWNDFDPQLIAEGLFAAANVFSALKLVHMFSINPHLGPLQISLGRMVIDIVKFFFIYSLVLFAFACGLNQLLWYFADLEKRKCYVLPDGEADWTGHGDSCMKWRRFGNLFESSQSLFWASFGMVGLDDFELTGIKSYTRFWGLLMFGSYSVINVIVLLNLLIAMMSNSYAMIDEHSDTEWKFARTKLWMSYFEDSSTLPPPFNIMPSVKWLIRVFRKSSKTIDRKRSKKRQEKQPENLYDNIMRSLVWRYVSAQHRKFEDNPVTEDDINEVKSDISTMRYEMLEIFGNSGMDVSSAAKKEKPCRAKRAKVWERRLMKGFQVAPVQTLLEQDTLGNVNGAGDINEIKIEREPSKLANETPMERFRRVAHAVAAQSASHKWTVVLQGVAKNSQIGRCNNTRSAKDLQHLGKAIEEAKKLILMSPPRSGRESPIPIEFDDEKTSTLLDLLNQISEEIDEQATLPTTLKKTQHKTQFLSADKPQQRDYNPKVKEHVGPLTTKPPIGPGSQSNKMNSRTSFFCNSNSNSNATKPSEIMLLAKNLVPQQRPDPYKPQAPIPGKSIMKKAAPVAPLPPLNPSSHTPFSVEVGRAGRHPNYVHPGQGSAPSANLNAFDLNVVDLDDRDIREQSSFDDVSEASSIGNINSPTRRRFREFRLNKSSSVDTDGEKIQTSAFKPTDEKSSAGSKSSSYAQKSNNDLGRKWL